VIPRLVPGGLLVADICHQPPERITAIRRLRPSPMSGSMPSLSPSVKANYCAVE
jgi:hypothetical protein